MITCIFAGTNVCYFHVWLSGDGNGTRFELSGKTSRLEPGFEIQLDINFFL